MKALTLLAACLALLARTTLGQGTFEADNRTAPTRIGSIDGPLAGTNILAQMLAGLSPTSLAPVGVPVAHSAALGFEGWVFGGIVAVPNAGVCRIAYVKMEAWDGTLWGQSLAAVPADQLGMTDTVPVFLDNPAMETCGANAFPRFTAAAVVPIPEPSGRALIIMAGVAVVLFRAVRGGLGRLGSDVPPRRT
jgi:hypothetical protein